MWLEIIVALITIVIVNGWLWNKITGRAPQPFAMPIIGNFYLCEPDPETGTPPMHNIFFRLAKKYGDIFGFQFGNKYSVVLSSPKAIRQGLKDHENATAGRFVPESMNIITQGVGIALQPDLKRWSNCRRKLVAAVTAKRMDNKKEATILEELHDMVCYLRNNQGKQFEFQKHTRRESINVLMRLVCSFRYGEEMSSEFTEIEDIMGNIFRAISAGNPSDYIPLAKLGNGAKKFVTELQDNTDRRDKHIGAWVQWHKDTMKKGEPRDFVDIMLADEGSAEEPKLSFAEVQSIIWDTMAGGIDTSALSFEWLVMILSHYPEIQDKIHEELDRVVGPSRLPTYEDVEDLPYLNATLCELFRFKHFAPFGIPHNTLEDIKICGYNVPKDTQVMFNLYTLHMDPDLWDDPTNFDPERFMEGGKDFELRGNYLDTDKVRTKYNAYKKAGNDAAADNLFKYLPFGFGKRQCVGFGLGRIIMFLKAATHLHCFNWESANGEKADLSEAFGVTLTPVKEFPVKVTARPAAKLAKQCDWKNKDDRMPGVWLN